MVEHNGSTIPCQCWLQSRKRTLAHFSKLRATPTSTNGLSALTGADTKDNVEKPPSFLSGPPTFMRSQHGISSRISDRLRVPNTPGRDNAVGGNVETQKKRKKNDTLFLYDFPSETGTDVPLDQFVRIGRAKAFPQRESRLLSETVLNLHSNGRPVHRPQSACPHLPPELL